MGLGSSRTQPGCQRGRGRRSVAALDGVSLTVNTVEGNRFGVNIIPHTRRETTFDTAEPGARLNLEIDLVARYLARLVGKDFA